MADLSIKPKSVANERVFLFLQPIIDYFWNLTAPIREAIESVYSVI
jgi:hypothetical protein